MTPTVKGSRAAIYIRISKEQQNSALQRDELPAYCTSRGWQVIETYEDHMTGGKDRRPQLDRLMADARRRKFDVVICWRFDRLARSTSHLLRALEELQGLGIDFVSLREAIDTSTATGKMVFTIIGAVSELERSIIRERVIAGQRAARRRGVRFGRPNVDVDVDEVSKLRNSGLSWRAIAAQTGLAKDTLRRALEG